MKTGIPLSLLMSYCGLDWVQMFVCFLALLSLSMGGHCAAWTHSGRILVCGQTDVQGAGVCCSVAVLAPTPPVLHSLMTVVQPSTVALPHPSCFSERLKCASQMFRAYTCRRHSLWHGLCGCVEHTQRHTHTHGRAHVCRCTYIRGCQNACGYASRLISGSEPTCRYTYRTRPHG